VTRPVRVVVASRLYPPEPGAAAYRLRALAGALGAAGAVVRVLTTRPPAGAPVPADDERVSRWPVLRDAGGNVRGYVQYASFDVPLVARLLASPRPDVVVVEPPPTTGVAVRVACALRRVPYVYYAADVVSLAARGIGVARPVVAVLEAVERHVMSRAAAVLTVSEEVAASIARLGVPRERVVVVGTGVDTDVFTPQGPRDEGTAPTAVYAGTMSEVHGATVFVEAMPRVLAEVPGARLVLVGQGSDVEEIRRRAAGLPPGSVEVTGRLPGPETARRLRSARVGLASTRPGRGYDVAFATKMFASTACGTPVVFAGVGPCVQAVREHGLGRAVAWTPEAVAEAMVALLREEPAASERARLATWTRDAYSLRGVARTAAQVVLAAAGRPAAG
jgi:glycosyltransferase involved in cell wall biosynthesis